MATRDERWTLWVLITGETLNIQEQLNSIEEPKRRNWGGNGAFFSKLPILTIIAPSKKMVGNWKMKFSFGMGITVSFREARLS